jgi:RNA polymerase sigma factor (sigma-70 family)
MDVQGLPPGARRLSESTQGPAAAPSRNGAPSAEQVGRALGEWQAGELRLARSFAECRGLPHEQLEDLYQETALALLGRPYHDEEHLRNALRWGIKHRALHLHRDERRRGEILQQRGPELQLAAERREAQRTPELAALLAQDRLVVSEFLTELSDLERRVFWLVAEGMRYRAIAPTLGIGVNEARKAARACERKRERFQLLYDTGRLCGFRSHTIHALQAGEGASEELAQRAFAHLEGCANCRAEHKTNARRLRRSFQGQAAALLPIPILAGRLGWLGRLEHRTRALSERMMPYSSPPTGGGVRERAIAMLASGGAAAKLAVAGASIVAIAGGTIGATGVLHHAPAHTRHARRISQRRALHASQQTGARTVAVAPTTSAGTTRPVRATSRQASSTPAKHQEATGFGFLGVPSSAQDSPARASAASANTTASRQPGPQPRSPGPPQRGGGPFSP